LSGAYCGMAAISSSVSGSSTPWLTGFLFWNQAPNWQ